MAGGRAAQHAPGATGGLEKNTTQLRVLFALAKLYTVRRQLIAAA